MIEPSLLEKVSPSGRRSDRAGGVRPELREASRWSERQARHEQEELVEQIRDDIRRFQVERPRPAGHDLVRSTETFIQQSAVHQTVESFETGLL